MKAVSAILLILSTGLWAVAQETATSTNTNGKPETIREMVNPAVSGSGKTNYVPLWLNPTTLGNSRIFQVGGKVGIDTTAPQFLLDVNGSINAKVSYLVGGTTFAFGSPGTGNVFLGFSGNNTMSGSGNTASGEKALYSNTSGSFNTAHGMWALWGNTIGFDNTAVGYEALMNNAGCDNTAVGYQALWGDEGGCSNTAVGSGALLDAIGSASWNTAYGAGALESISGSYNTAIGTDALLSYTSGSYTTALGYDADASSTGISNATAVGANAYVARSNTLVLGCVAGVNYCQGAVSVGIGTTAPDNMLTVNRSADKPGGGSWGTYSDRRLKTLDGSFKSGLSQIMKLHPVRYRYNKENALDIRDEQEHVGLVAQDVQAVIPEAVTENSKGYLLLNNDPILWSMLNAIKEQQAQIGKQREQIRVQQAQLIRLTRQVKTIQATLKANGQRGSAVRTAQAGGSAVRQ